MRKFLSKQEAGRKFHIIKNELKFLEIIDLDSRFSIGMLFQKKEMKNEKKMKK